MTFFVSKGENSNSCLEELYSDVTQRHSRSDSVPSRSNSASDRTHFGGVSRSHSVGDPSNHGIRIETHSPSPTHVSHLRKPKEHGHGTKEHSPQLSPRGGSPESPVDRKPSPQLSPRPKHALRQSPVDPDSASPRLRANPGPAQTQEKIDQLNKQKEALMAEKTRIEKEKKKRAKEEKERQGNKAHTHPPYWKTGSSSLAFKPLFNRLFRKISLLTTTRSSYCRWSNWSWSRKKSNKRKKRKIRTIKESSGLITSI